MPLLERARVEVYLPNLPAEAYGKLLEAFNQEFTYALELNHILSVTQVQISDLYVSPCTQ